jgi:hypothetical protein
MLEMKKKEGEDSLTNSPLRCSWGFSEAMLQMCGASLRIYKSIWSRQSGILRLERSCL